MTSINFNAVLTPELIKRVVTGEDYPRIDYAIGDEFPDLERRNATVDRNLVELAKTYGQQPLFTGCLRALTSMHENMAGAFIAYCKRTLDHYQGQGKDAIAEGFDALIVALSATFDTLEPLRDAMDDLVSSIDEIARTALFEQLVAHASGLADALTEPMKGHAATPGGDSTVPAEFDPMTSIIGESNTEPAPATNIA